MTFPEYAPFSEMNCFSRQRYGNREVRPAWAPATSARAKHAVAPATPKSNNLNNQFLQKRKLMMTLTRDQ
jgi:hypothetical protein